VLRAHTHTQTHTHTQMQMTYMTDSRESVRVSDRESRRERECVRESPRESNRRPKATSVADVREKEEARDLSLGLDRTYLIDLRERACV